MVWLRDDRRLCRCGCCIWSSSGWSAGWCCSPAARRRRMPSCWCCETRSRCCGEAIRGHGWTRRTGLTGVLAALIRLLPAAVKNHRLVSPGTVLGWRRRLVVTRWTFPNRTGRPPLPAQVAALIERLARENTSWGYPGAISGSMASCARSAIEWAPRRSAAFCSAPEYRRRRPAAPPRGGGSSCASRRRQRSRSTSSMSTP